MMVCRFFNGDEDQKQDCVRLVLNGNVNVQKCKS